MNPIIETIEVGHVSHGTKCKLCRTDWPCKSIQQARVHNKTYVPLPVVTDDTLVPIEPHKDRL